MPDDELAAARARIAELEAENAALGSTFETWRRVVVLLRKRIERVLRAEGRAGG